MERIWFHNQKCVLKVAKLGKTNFHSLQLAVSEDMLIPVKIARQLNSGVYKNPMEELIAKAASSNNYILLTVHREQAWTVVMRVCITISGIKEQ